MLRKLALVLLPVVLAGTAWLGVNIAQTATAAPAVVTPGNTVSTVYGCQNASGAFDYWEFRTPIPHKCYFSGETLVALPGIVLGEGSTFPLDVTLPGSSTADHETCTVAQLTSGLGLSCVASTSSG
jgi:hypothetical protein